MNLVFCAFSESLCTANQPDIFANSECILFEISEILLLPSCVKEQRRLIRVVSSAYDRYKI